MPPAEKATTARIGLVGQVCAHASPLAKAKPRTDSDMKGCARAATGHVAAPPRSMMNSRRLRAGMGSPHPVQPVSRTLSLARKDWLVLGAMLNPLCYLSPAR